MIPFEYPGYVPLHVHSTYSLLEGVITIEQIIEKALSYNMDSIALTDTNGMHGLIHFYKTAVEKGIKPILGAYIDEPEEEGAGKTYAVFLAKNLEGYSDICRIITSRKLKGDMPGGTGQESFSLFRLLHEYFPNLFIFSSSAALLESIPLYDNIFAELIITGEHRKDSLLLYELIRKRNLKYIISNPVYFSSPGDFMLHKVVSAVKNRATFENIKEELLVDKEFYFKDPDSFSSLYKKLPEGFTNIRYIIDNCNVDLGVGEYKFPEFPGLKGEDSFSYLWRISYSGLKTRYENITEKIFPSSGIKTKAVSPEERLEEELRVIDDMHLSDYFLVVWGILKEAKRRGMMTIGRGSAANSIVSYCLGITEIDPIKYNLYFERFLNKSRSSPPDIDLDFSWKERDEIVKYVFEKYGYEHTAFISTHVTFRARSAFRETAKVFGFSDAEISKMSKFIPWTDARNLPGIAELFPESRSLQFNKEPWKTIVNIAAQLVNFPRHLSIHPGGIVIAPKPITNYTALEFAQNKGVGLIITQPDMHGIEDIGLVKIDLLSQRSLGVLRDTIKLLESNGRKSMNA
ncbi:MAG TPA: PHP domain-containing protein [Ignavibacteriaceae bacterium]|nr:PHP domain-containing protein [Ignavibacteriaceae bacterium]